MRTASAQGSSTAPDQKMADFRGFFSLARLMLIDRHRGNLRSGRMIMARFEAVAFTVGFVLTGFLSLAAVPLA